MSSWPAHCDMFSSGTLAQPRFHPLQNLLRSANIIKMDRGAGCSLCTSSFVVIRPCCTAPFLLRLVHCAAECGPCDRPTDDSAHTSIVPQLVRPTIVIVCFSATFSAFLCDWTGYGRLLFAQVWNFLCKQAEAASVDAWHFCVVVFFQGLLWQTWYVLQKQLLNPTLYSSSEK